MWGTVMSSPTETPLVAIHLVVLRQAVCHDCGWQGQLRELQREAEFDAAGHDCWAEWRAIRDSNP